MRNQRYFFLLLAFICFPVFAENIAVTIKDIRETFDNVGRLATDDEINEMMEEGSGGFSFLLRQLNLSRDDLMNVQ